MLKKQWGEWIWEAWCIFSGIGIWPRYIEPKLLKVSHVALPISQLPKELVNLRILHFSDLHWNGRFSPYFQRKLIQKVNALEPDLIFFTGDFLCCANLENPEGLKKILTSLKAKIGYFAVFGNHDYSQFVTVNEQGDYDVEVPSSTSTISKGFKRLFRPVTLTKQVTSRALQVQWNAELVALLEQTPFQLLDNRTQRVAYRGTWLNICGLGEYSMGKCQPDIAFRDYDTQYPGIVLSHNPDSLATLAEYPGELILAGHTHGGQINLPGLWHRFMRVEQVQFKRGLKRIGKKWAYINRGIASIMPFRWFATPELTLLTLQKGSL